MRIGAFELDEWPLTLKEPHALAVLQPWIDAGSAGSQALSRLETFLGARPLGRLARPGNFFDFTRYRPTMYLRGGRREVSLPNTMVSYAQQEEGHDFVFLHLLEPHMLGEDYVDSVAQLLVKLGVKRYCLLGSMYDVVPHTRPLVITGSASGEKAAQELKKVGAQSSGYQGPTTIMSLLFQQGPNLSMETMLFLVHLPQYAPLEEDYSGTLRLLELLCTLYKLPLDLSEVRRLARNWYREVSSVVEATPELKDLVSQLEEHYGKRTKRGEKRDGPRLSPEVERFLKRMTRRLEQQ
jgi:predicted ATP-grasp superfamily ATP-dependent carboligase